MLSESHKCINSLVMLKLLRFSKINHLGRHHLLVSNVECRGKLYSRFTSR